MKIYNLIFHVDVHLYFLFEKEMSKIVKWFLKKNYKKDIPKGIGIIIMEFTFQDLLVSSFYALKPDTWHVFKNIIMEKKSRITSDTYDKKSNKGGKLYIYVEKLIHIGVAAKITMTNKGYAGGKQYYSGSSYDGNSGYRVSSNNFGGGGCGLDLFNGAGGGGFGSWGSNGDIGAGGTSYGDRELTELHMGSGGGGGGFDDERSLNVEIFGGNGGGCIKIICNKMIIERFGGIHCNGGNGTMNSGGGSGGSIWIICKDLNNKGAIVAKGGKGNKMGGNGGVGRIRMDTLSLENKGVTIPRVGYISKNI